VLLRCQRGVWIRVVDRAGRKLGVFTALDLARAAYIRGSLARVGAGKVTLTEAAARCA
jgi:hypothetical protein